MHMDIMTIQPNQGSRSKETQNREISPENADRMQNADFRERHRGNSSPSRSSSGTGSIQTIWVRLHRSFAPRQRVFAPKCPPPGKRKDSAKVSPRDYMDEPALHLLGRPRINHTHAIHAARHWPQKLYKPPIQTRPTRVRDRGSRSRWRTVPKNKKHIICKNRLVALT